MSNSGLDLFFGFLAEFGIISPKNIDGGYLDKSHKLNLGKSNHFYITELGFEGNADFYEIFNNVINKYNVYDVLNYVKLFDFVDIKNEIEDVATPPSIFISSSDSSLIVNLVYDNVQVDANERSNIKRNLLTSVLLYIVKNKPNFYNYKNYIFLKSSNDAVNNIFNAMQPIIKLVDYTVDNYMTMTIDQFSRECLKTWKSSEQVEKLRLSRITELLESLHAAMGVSTEANEILDIYKKSIMYNRPIDKKHLIEELGDLFFYGCMLAYENDISMGQIFESNVNKLRERYKSSFTFEEANNKNHEKEMKAFES